MSTMLFAGACSTYHVSTQVNTKNCNNAQRLWNADYDEHQEWGDLRNVTGQSVGDGLLQVVKDQTTWRRKDETRRSMIFLF